MQREAFNTLHKMLRGAMIAFVLFGMLLSPADVFANHTISDFIEDVPPPGNWDGNISRSWNSNMRTERPLTRRQDGISIQGTIPVAGYSFDSAHMINAEIESIVDSLIAEARRLRARAISFSHEYHSTDEVASFVIFANVITTLPHTLVQSVNFSVSDGRLLSMDEATGMNIIPLAERILSDIIRSNPERYYAALSAPLASQAFYLTHSQLVILFDGFRLSTRMGEAAAIELSLRNIRTVVLSQGEYRPDGPYGLKMIPLRDVLHYRLGYNVRWCYDTSRAVISHGGVDIIELRPGDNEYIIFGTQRRQLETAPESIGGSIYVPITFFDEILPLTTYTIGFDRSITFLSYLAN
ncbi:MAG: copper amine oxidase N-terminal domain-containing protein [Defluviitaleaceae bacterium]|nr:copper amine oxidase N-terminal domain-containing protein [Defluviitaleaceae bacterium]